MSALTPPTITEKASTILTIENFSLITDDYKEILFSPSSNDKILFDFGLFPKSSFNTPNWFNDDVLTYLWFRVIDRDKITVQYSASILGTGGVKCYTQEYRWNYNKHKRIGHHFAKFISRDELLDPTNGYLENDTLQIFCEVLIIDENHKPVQHEPESQSHTPQLSLDFQNLYETGKFADIVFIVDGKEFLAHKTILAARSEVFAAMFVHDTREKQESRVVIPDVSVDVFEQLLRYLYTDKVQAVDTLAFELFTVADKYQLPSLKRICTEQLCTVLSIDSVTSFLLLAEMHQAADLKEKCIEYIAENARDVVQTDGWTKMTAVRPELAVQLFKFLAFKV